MSIHATIIIIHVCMYVYIKWYVRSTCQKREDLHNSAIRAQMTDKQILIYCEYSIGSLYNLHYSTGRAAFPLIRSTHSSIGSYLQRSLRPLFMVCNTFSSPICMHTISQMDRMMSAFSSHYFNLHISRAHIEEVLRIT